MHPPLANSTPSADPQLERLARRRATAKLAWYRHALVCAAVVLGLTALSLHQGRYWVVYPALGMGLGLALHGAAIWWHGSGRWYQRLLEQERRALRRQHD